MKFQCNFGAINENYTYFKFFKNIPIVKKGKNCIHVKN